MLRFVSGFNLLLTLATIVIFWEFDPRYGGDAESLDGMKYMTTCINQLYLFLNAFLTSIVS